MRALTVGEVEHNLREYLTAVSAEVHAGHTAPSGLYFYNANTQTIRDLLQINGASDPEAMALHPDGRCVYTVVPTQLGLSLVLIDPRSPSGYSSITVCCAEIFIESNDPREWQEYKLPPGSVR